MIKVAIKHFIYEKCISIFFNAIDRNFHIPKVTKFTENLLHALDVFNYMEHNVKRGIKKDLSKYKIVYSNNDKILLESIGIDETEYICVENGMVVKVTHRTDFDTFEEIFR